MTIFYKFKSDDNLQNKSDKYKNVTDLKTDNIRKVTKMKPVDEVIDVWADNVEEELTKISKLVETYRFIGMDTEFSGFIVKTYNNTPEDIKYHAEQQNVNLLKLIQIGITLGDDKGNRPQPICTWQFNFKFDVNSDIQAAESISLLRQSGIDFNKILEDGIDIYDFVPLFYASGLVMNDKINWITFQCGYDIAYLVKLVSAQPMPKSEADFAKVVKLYFPNYYDLRYIIGTISDQVGSLQDVANELNVHRYGPTHQAGSDSYVTLLSYYKAMQEHFGGNLTQEKFRNKGQ